MRAKTGTLTGVHGLAGIVTGRDGTSMLFVAVADRVKVANTLVARARLDQVAAALAACRCALLTALTPSRRTPVPGPRVPASVELGA